MTLSIRITTVFFTLSFFQAPPLTAQVNEPPVITGQVPISTPEETPVEITLSHLTVTDPDNTYPDGFTLSLSGGPHYTLDQNNVIPSRNFTGTLTVPVRVNDGQADSEPFDLLITVTEAPIENIKPVITGQTQLTTAEDQPITINLENLIVDDPDNVYPNDFTLRLSDGANYSWSGQTVTPQAGFSGTLSVPVVVNDGQTDSDPFNLSITVTPGNVPPVITGQVPLSTPTDVPITLTLADLIVNDPDDAYPTGFTLTVSNGLNYTANGTTITPTAGFSGTLTAGVIVNDGEDNSEEYFITITVNAPENIPPKITGQIPLTTAANTPITIEFSSLNVTDPDDAYPAGFTMSLSPGADYSVNDRTITPAAGFTGNLTVPVTVNDGQAESPPFELTITVSAPPNVRPVITGQVELITEEKKVLTIDLSHLIVTDPDNDYPDDFTLKIYAGPNYTTNGKNVNPAGGFTGILKVPVTVNDGTSESEKFELIVTVTPKAPANVKPVIAGQIALSALNTQSITITLSHLIVTDPDNVYPDDFTLKVHPGSDYAVSGNTVTPGSGFTGILTVKVTVNDGKANSDPFDLKITISAPVTNDKPIITGQQELNTFVNTELAIRVTHLIITDPDNTFPNDFSLTLLEGDNYTISGTTLKPVTDFVGVLLVPVQVSDGIAISDAFILTVSVIQKDQLRIIGQEELVTREDSTLTLAFSQLNVSDPSGTYPDGFELIIGAGGNNFSSTGRTIKPAKDYSGILEVPVQISKSGQVSNIFRVIVYVTPVNDAPRFTAFDGSPIRYNLGTGPATLASEAMIEDPDNERLAYAEIYIDPLRYTPGKDLLIAESTETIRSIFDPATGVLVLLGAGTLDEYQELIRSAQYSYNNDTLPPSLTKPIHFRLNDGASFNDLTVKNIQMTESIQLDIPNVFSPNNDLKNDQWVISKQIQPVNTSTTIRVFDKTGILVYESFVLDEVWDGTYRGRALPSGTYFYSIEIRGNGNNLSKKGTVNILR